jgi:hypothetical protein
MKKSTLFLSSALSLFVGIVIGFVFAPIKHGISIGNNSGNNCGNHNLPRKSNDENRGRTDNNHEIIRF